MGAVRARWEPIARAAAAVHGIDPDLFARQIEQESGWDPEAENPVSHAYGLGQFTPAAYPEARTWTPEQQLDKAAATMRAYRNLFHGDMALALAAYNGGPGAILRWHSAYGDDWRAALVEHAAQWPAVTGCGTPAKAGEVSRYLDRILGQEAPVSANPPGGIVWVPSPNFQSGRGGSKPLAIVDHIMAGTLPGCDSWFGNSASQVSAHFGVGKKGEIHQYVKVEDTAWANGKPGNPNLTIDWLADALRAGTNPNRVTLSIEHEGQPGDTMPDAQYKSSLALHVYLCRRFGIPADADHVIGHNQIDRVNRPNCPGPSFPWDRLLGDLAQVLDPPAPAPANNDGLYRLIMAEADEIAAAAAEMKRLATPGSEGGPTDISDSQAVGGVHNAARIIQDHAIKAVDLAAQVRV